MCVQSLLGLRSLPVWYFGSSVYSILFVPWAFWVIWEFKVSSISLGSSGSAGIFDSPWSFGSFWLFFNLLGRMGIQSLLGLRSVPGAK